MMVRWVKFNDCRGWKKCEKVRKNATFARYLGGYLAQFEAKKDVFDRNLRTFCGVAYVVFLKHTLCVFD